MPTAKSTTYRARTHRLRGGAKTPAAKSAKAKKPATKKSTKPELTPRMKEFVELAKARKEREFFEKLTDAELNTFAKALKMKPSDSREKKLAEVIAYSKKSRSALIIAMTSVLGILCTGIAATIAYPIWLRYKNTKYVPEKHQYKINENDKFIKFSLMLNKIFIGVTVGSAIFFSTRYNQFKRFQKALRALK